MGSGVPRCGSPQLKVDGLGPDAVADDSTTRQAFDRLDVERRKNFAFEAEVGVAGPEDGDDGTPAHRSPERGGHVDSRTCKVVGTSMLTGGEPGSSTALMTSSATRVPIKYLGTWTDVIGGWKSSQ